MTKLLLAISADSRTSEWNKMNEDGVVNDMSAPGLAGLPRRSGKKPIIAAVNGICMGGGEPSDSSSHNGAQLRFR